MKTQRTIEFLALIILCVPLPRLHAAEKSIYIKPFAVVQGMPATDTAGSQVKDYLSESVIERGGYAITSDDEVKQVIEQEEMKMSLDACYDDACIKKLMESIRTDFIIYGTVSFIEEKYYIAAKILDRTTGTVKLSRVKTLEFGERAMIKHASRALGEYLITGNNGPIKDFEDMERRRAREKHETVLDQPDNKMERIVSRASLMRFGWGYPIMVDSVLRGNYFSSQGTGIFDIFLWRQRNSKGDGFDFFARGSLEYWKSNRDNHQPIDKAYLSGDDLDMKELYEADIFFFGVNMGVRYIFGTYFSGILWQGYVSAAYKITIAGSDDYHYLTNSDNDKEVEIDFTAHGFVAGIGMELGLFANFAIFLECTAGYCPAGDKKRNVEGVSFLGGVTLRTKVWRF